MTIAKLVALIVYFVSMLPLFLIGWLAAFLWTPLAGGFWWGNRHIDAALAVRGKTWSYRVEQEVEE